MDSEKLPETPKEDGVFIPRDELDGLIRLSGEMIVFKNYFHLLGAHITQGSSKSDRTETATTAAQAKTDREQEALAQKLGEMTFRVNKLSDQLQSQITSVRTINLGRICATLAEVTPNIVFDLSGCDLGIERTIADAVTAAVTGVVRHCSLRSFEPETERQQTGKPVQGRIVISAVQTNDLIRIILADDGHGKAVVSSLPEELAQAIAAIKPIGGKLDFDAKTGKGSTFTITLPSSTTVMVEQTILSQSGRTLLAVPLSSISRIIPSRETIISEVSGYAACQHEGKTIPIGTFAQLTGTVTSRRKTSLEGQTIIILQHKGKPAGLVVDAVADQLEAVIRPFDGVVKSVPGLKGTTISGGDEIAYVVAPEDLVRLAYSGIEKAKGDKRNDS